MWYATSGTIHWWKNHILGKFKYLTSVMVLMTVIRNKENVKRVYIECELKSQNFVTRLELRTSRKFRLKFGVAELNDGNFLDVWFPKPRYEEFDCMLIEIWSSSILLWLWKPNIQKITII